MPRKSGKPQASKRDRRLDKAGLQPTPMGRKIDPDALGAMRSKDARKPCAACGGSHRSGEYCYALREKVW
jgi:hypothetical protein